MARLTLILALLYTCLPHLVHGQETPPKSDSGKSLLYEGAKDDSLDIYWYDWQKDRSLFRYDDTLPQGELYIYEPGWDGRRPMANLGNTGSPARSLWWDPSEEETGIRLGTRPWERYRWNLREFSYPKANIAYTRVTVVQGTSPINTTAERQQNGRFDLLFTRPFGDRLQVFLDYRWLDFDGSYEKQRAKIGKLATGLDFITRDSVYDVRFLVLMNAGNWEDNGGITSDSLLIDQDPFRIRNNIPVRISAGRSRLQERQIALEQTVRFSKNIPAIRILSQYYTGYRKHTDNRPNSGYYPDEFLFDDRGLRRFGQLRYFDNELFWPLLDNQQMGLTVGGGMRNASFRTEVEGPVSRYTQLGVSGAFRFSPEKWDLEARTRINWVDGSINYRLHSHLGYEPWKDIQLKGSFWLTRHRTALMDTEFTFNSVSYASGNAEHTGASGLDLELNFKRWGVSAKGRLANLQGQVLFNRSLDAFERLDENVAIGQISLEHQLDWGILHWRNGAGFQALGGYATELGMPDYYLTSTLRIESYIFRRSMWMTTGLYLMYVPEFQSLDYFPIIGEWVQARDVSPVNAYPLVNYFFQFRVDKLQGFVLLENLASFITDDHWFTTPGYPMQDFGYRVGIMWHFRN